MTHRLLFLLFFSLLGSQSAIGADAQVWINAGMRYKPTKKVSLNVNQHLRLDQNVSRVQGILTDLSVSWRAKKWFRLGGGYRFQMDSNKDGLLLPGHRLHIQARLKHGFGPVDLSYRLRFQETLEHDEGEIDARHTMRNRIGVDFDTNTIVTPGLSAELYTRFADKEPVLLKKLRITTGFDIKPTKSHVLTVYYRLHVPIYEKDDPKDHIVGLGYQYRIPRKKKK